MLAVVGALSTLLSAELVVRIATAVSRSTPVLTTELSPSPSATMLMATAAGSGVDGAVVDDDRPRRRRGQDAAARHLSERVRVV